MATAVASCDLTMPDSSGRVDSSMPWCTCPFSKEEAAKHIPFDIGNSVYLEVQSNDQPLFSYMLPFISKRVKNAQSIRADMGKGFASALGFTVVIDDDFHDDILTSKGKGRGRKRKREVTVPEANIGLGWYTFDFEYNGKSVPVAVCHQWIGHPVGGPGGPSFFSSIVLFTEGSDQAPLLHVCREATDAATKVKENRVSLWRYDTKRNFWMQVSRRLARSMDSVVLDETMKKPLLDDIGWFVKDDTRAFYAKHGIPYHRCYLFHGEPGTGKTSFIYALAGHLERNLCFVQMDRSMTDDMFRKAMSQLPSMAMLVLEDVDALFTHHRESEQNSCSLSFSGFLNCLDGLGAPDDVVICMTTNHPDRLDPAVLRPGRVDVKVSFKSPSREVATKYFLTFYPEATEAAQSFGKYVGSRFAERKISMAQMQHYFLVCHRQESTPEQAADSIKDFAFEDSFSTSSRSSLYG